MYLPCSTRGGISSCGEMASVTDWDTRLETAAVGMSDSKVILIIDDDAEFVESNRDLLEAYGYIVHTASNGTEGLARAKDLRPDLIILDVMMAALTEGFDVARRISEAPELRDVKILLVTGMRDMLRLEKPLEPERSWLPVDRVLDKPISPPRLLAEIERLLGVPVRREERGAPQG